MNKTLATCMILAATQALDEPSYGAFTAMAIPDYLAGLVFGLTGDN